MTRFLSLLVLFVIKRLPTSWIYPVARMYIAGTTRDQAIALANQLWHDHGVYSVIDHLGEEPADWDEVQDYYDEYLKLCIACADRRHIALSAKLLSFT